MQGTLGGEISQYGTLQRVLCPLRCVVAIINSVRCLIQSHILFFFFFFFLSFFLSFFIYSSVMPFADPDAKDLV